MDLRLQGLCCVVTGASSGIGLATARRFLTEGARVAVCARGRERLETEADRLRGDFGPERVHVGVCDVLDPQSVETFTAEVASVLGGIDVLVNNAGQGSIGKFEDTSDSQWRSELEEKFFSVVYPTRCALPYLRRSNGSVVNVNSVIARQPSGIMVAAGAARAGVLNLARALATELAGDGIRVNTVLAGPIMTGWWRRAWAEAKTEQAEADWFAARAAERGVLMGRFGTAEEVADCVAFLASPLASFVTGATLEIDGGLARYV